MRGMASAISHTLAEAYSSLTRMPAIQRTSEPDVIAYFFDQFTHEISIPPYLNSLEELAHPGSTCRRYLRGGWCSLRTTELGADL